MSYAQMIEEADYSAAARYDRFDGFDRGDLDTEPEADTFTALGRMTAANGERVEFGVWTGPASEGFAEVRVDGVTVFGEFDAEAQARAIARRRLAA